MDAVISAFLFGPVATTTVGVFLLHSGLRQPGKLIWWRIASCTILLAVTPYWLSRIAQLGDLAIVYVFLLTLFLACVAIVSGLWMLWVLHKWRKVASATVAVAFPILLWFGFLAGMSNAPEEATENNGDQIVQVLRDYHTHSGVYPKQLAQLEPEYLTILPQALTTQGTGWLYSSDGTTFTLGYWKWPEKFGAWVCLYESDNPKWVCDLNHWGPFQEVPTPGPCLNDQGSMGQYN